MQKTRRKNDLDLRRGAGLGLDLGLAVALFTLLGYWLDSWLDTSPTWLIVGALLGAAGGMLHVVRAVSAMGRRSDEPPPR